jgi:hypothetical protein
MVGFPVCSLEVLCGNNPDMGSGHIFQSIQTHFTKNKRLQNYISLIYEVPCTSWSVLQPTICQTINHTARYGLYRKSVSNCGHKLKTCDIKNLDRQGVPVARGHDRHANLLQAGHEFWSGAWLCEVVSCHDLGWYVIK